MEIAAVCPSCAGNLVTNYFDRYTLIADYREKRALVKTALDAGANLVVGNECFLMSTCFKYLNKQLEKDYGLSYSLITGAMRPEIYQTPEFLNTLMVYSNGQLVIDRVKEYPSPFDKQFLMAIKEIGECEQHQYPLTKVNGHVILPLLCAEIDSLLYGNVEVPETTPDAITLSCMGLSTVDSGLSTPDSPQGCTVKFYEQILLSSIENAFTKFEERGFIKPGGKIVFSNPLYSEGWIPRTIVAEKNKITVGGELLFTEI